MIIEALVHAPGAEDAQHRGALRIGGREIDFDRQSPIVVADGVVEDLAYLPSGRLPVDDQQRRAAGVSASARWGYSPLWLVG